VEGEWRTDAPGVGLEQLENCATDKDGNPVPPCDLAYFCGFDGNSGVSGRERLLSNGGGVWNVKPLGCVADPERRWLCDNNREWDNKFLLRSLAGGDANKDGLVDNRDYECMWFPAGGTQSHPRRISRKGSPDGQWLGSGGAADADGNGDPDCGIALNGAETQEKALVENRQAVYSLIPLPSY